MRSPTKARVVSSPAPEGWHERVGGRVLGTCRARPRHSDQLANRRIEDARKQSDVFEKATERAEYLRELTERQAAELLAEREKVVALSAEAMELRNTLEAARNRWPVSAAARLMPRAFE